MSADAIAGATRCLDDFMAAFNARDLKAWRRRSISRRCGWRRTRSSSSTSRAGIRPTRSRAARSAEWDHSAWERRAIIHAGPDKVHFDTRLRPATRADGSVIGHFDSVYVVTREEGHWGVKARSSFAP